MADVSLSVWKLHRFKNITVEESVVTGLELMDCKYACDWQTQLDVKYPFTVKSDLSVQRLKVMSGENSSRDDV